MHLETDAMSEPVAEQLAKTAPFDVATGDRIRVTPGHAGANVLRGLLIRLANDVVYLALLVCRSANHDGPRDVGAVPLDFRAEVDEQDVAVTDLCHRGSRVRKRRPRSGRHDGRERKAFAAFVAQRALEHARDLQLGHADAHFRQRSLERANRHPRGTLDQQHLVRVLSLTQDFDEIERRAPLPARTGFHQSLEVAMQQVSRLETNHLSGRHLRQLLPQPAPQTLRLDQHAGRVADLVGGLRLIAKIGDENRVALAHEEQRARTGESRQISNIREARHEQRVDMSSR